MTVETKDLEAAVEAILFATGGFAPIAPAPVVPVDMVPHLRKLLSVDGLHGDAIKEYQDPEDGILYVYAITREEWEARRISP